MRWKIIFVNAGIVIVLCLITFAFLAGSLGNVVAIQAELGIPVKLVGLGESAEDLVAFDPDEFVEALFTA